MIRYTTDNPKTNVENMLNLAFAKDGLVNIRGMSESFMQYISNACRKYGCSFFDFNDEEIAETITECAFSNPYCPIFLLFTVSTQAAELRERLKRYEDSGFNPEEIKRIADAIERTELSVALSKAEAEKVAAI